MIYDKFRRHRQNNMQRITTLTLIFFSFVILACPSQNNNSQFENKNSNDTIVTTTTKNDNKLTDYFPFNVRNNDGQFSIIVETESPELYPKYADFFEKHGYSGNGYCWEGHITQILEKLNPELLQHIDFDSEAGAFFAYADTEANQLKFVKLLSPIFAEFTKLEEYVKKADRSRIDD